MSLFDTWDPMGSRKSRRPTSLLDQNPLDAFGGGRGAPGGSGFFDLTDSVGFDGANRRSDVIKVESLLAASGELDDGGTDGPTGYFGQNLEDGIRRYQRNRGLKTDGRLDPGGATISTLRGQLKSRFGDRPAPTPDQVEAHHKALAAGKDSPLRPKPKPLRLRPPAQAMPADDASFSGNRRLVDHLGTTRDDGLLPKLFSDALQTGGTRAEAEFRDFMDQLGKRDPARAATLGRKIHGALPADQRERLFMPEDRPDPGDARTLECKPGECESGKDARPMPYRPGWVFENGRWRPETPEERARPEFRNMELEEENKEKKGDGESPDTDADSLVGPGGEGQPDEGSSKPSVPEEPGDGDKPSPHLSEHDKDRLAAALDRLKKAGDAEKLDRFREALATHATPEQRQEIELRHEAQDALRDVWGKGQKGLEDVLPKIRRAYPDDAKRKELENLARMAAQGNEVGALEYAPTELLKSELEEMKLRDKLGLFGGAIAGESPRMGKTRGGKTSGSTRDETAGKPGKRPLFRKPNLSEFLTDMADALSGDQPPASLRGTDSVGSDYHDRIISELRRRGEL